MLTFKVDSDFKFKLRDLKFIFSDWNYGRQHRQAKELVNARYKNVSYPEYFNSRRNVIDRCKWRSVEDRKLYQKVRLALLQEGEEAALEVYEANGGVKGLT